MFLASIEYHDLYTELFRVANTGMRRREVLGLTWDTIPAHLHRSVTFNRGAEWAEWQTMAASYRLDVWFCDPHSPWQRGQCENHNRQARWWFPGGTNHATVGPADAQAVADLLNHQRRRILNGSSPATLYAALTARRSLELTVPIAATNPTRETRHMRVRIEYCSGRWETNDKDRSVQPQRWREQDHDSVQSRLDVGRAGP